MNYKEISEICTKQRKALGLTISALASKAHTSNHNVRLIGTGNIGSMKLSIFLKILSALSLELKLIEKEKSRFFDDLNESINEAIEVTKHLEE